MFFKWIRDQQILIILVCLIIIGVCLPIMLYANANLPELVQRNVNDSLIILVEMQHEAGEDYIEAKKDYEYLLPKFRGHMEERSCSLLLRLLYPELSPRKQLTSALDILTKSKDDQAKNDIKKAAKTIRQFVSNSLNFSDIQVLTFEPEDLPEELLNDAKSALDNSREYVKRYMDDPNIANAQEACRKNRTATALAYLVRCVFQDFSSLENELKQFRGDINRTIYYNHLLQGKKEISEKDKKLLDNYSNSELRRLEILQALLDKDIHKAENFVRNSANISASADISA